MRSTQIVKDCFGPDLATPTSPPDIDISSLSGESRKPTLAEVKAVLDLRHLVRYFECTALDPSRVENSWGRGEKHLLDESLHLLPSWQEGFYRAAYRSFIAGSVLAKFYLDPILNAREVNAHFLEGLTFQLVTEFDKSKGGLTDFPIERGELDILSKSPIYNFTLHSGWESCFGAFGEWLVEETRQRLNFENSNDSPPSKIEGEVLKEILQLLIFYGQLSDMEGSLLGSDMEPIWCRHRPGPNGRCICKQHSQEYRERDSQMYYREYEAKEEKLRAAKTRTVPVIFLGDYFPQDVELSANASEFGQESCVFSVPERDTEITAFPELVDLYIITHCMSGRPNHVNSHQAPHPPLHLFTFLLRKYFAYQFDELAFEVNAEYPVYQDFIRRGKIFSSEGGWDGLLTSVPPEQVLSYREIGWSRLII